MRAAVFGEQIGADPRRKSRRCSSEHRPDRLLILGDTNSGLSAIVARRLGIPVYHMEAGNRCYDDRVPEEVNRRVIDHSSVVLHAVHEPEPGEPAARGDRGRADLRDGEPDQGGDRPLRRRRSPPAMCCETLDVEPRRNTSW